MVRLFLIVTVFTCMSFGVLSAQSGTHETRAKEIFKQLVEINTTHSVGDTTKAAEAMAATAHGSTLSHAAARSSYSETTRPRTDRRSARSRPDIQARRASKIAAFLEASECAAETRA